MTNGTVVILGSTGRNFGAGMSGGSAFVLDVEDSFLDRYNAGMIEPQRVTSGSAEEARLRGLIEEHVEQTGSAWGRHVLAHWDEALDCFWHVMPNTTPAVRNSQALMHVPNWSTRRRSLLAVQAQAQAVAAAAAAQAAAASSASGSGPNSSSPIASSGSVPLSMKAGAASFSTQATAGAARQLK